jgi:1-phosphofructokinase family hexose kinase
MKKVITICLNTAIDNIVEIENFECGIVTNSKYSKYYPSGKAINTARTIASYGENVLALGFVGEAELPFFKSLNSRNLHISLKKAIGRTRTNITLIDKNHELIIHVRGSGYKLTKNELLEIMTELSLVASQDDIVVISGSIPPGLPLSSFKQIILHCKKLGLKVILDSSGKFLKNAISALPYVLKPNMEELKELFGMNISSESEIVSATKQLNNLGIELVFVSNGSEGVILTKRNQEGYWKANVKLEDVKYKGEEIGCGDAMVGGISIGLKNNYDIDSLLRIAVSCGAANLLKEGPGVCNKMDISKFFKNVSVIKKMF